MRLARGSLWQLGTCAVLQPKRNKQKSANKKSKKKACSHQTLSARHEEIHSEYFAASRRRPVPTVILAQSNVRGENRILRYCRKYAESGLTSRWFLVASPKRSKQHLFHDMRKLGTTAAVKQSSWSLLTKVTKKARSHRDGQK